MNFINSLDFSQIKSKIYFNPELLSLRKIVSLTILTISIYLLFLILRKLKINLYLISLSLVVFNFISNFFYIDVNGKIHFIYYFF